MHIIDNIKDYISRRQMAHRTMLAYIQDIEVFLHKYPDIANHPENLKANHINDYLTQLRESVVSTALYNQTLSALKLLSTYMHDTYKIPVIDFAQHTWNGSFPLTCSDEQITQILGGLEGSYEDLRISLIIRLLSTYKLQLKQLTQLVWSPTGISLNGKQLLLKAKDKDLLALYKKKVFAVHGSLEQHVFVVASSVGSQVISQPALWSLLKKAFSDTPLYRMKRSAQLQTNPFTRIHPRG